MDVHIHCNTSLPLSLSMYLYIYMCIYAFFECISSKNDSGNEQLVSSLGDSVVSVIRAWTPRLVENVGV